MNRSPYRIANCCIRMRTSHGIVVPLPSKKGFALWRSTLACSTVGGAGQGLACGERTGPALFARTRHIAGWRPAQVNRSRYGRLFSPGQVSKSGGSARRHSRRSSDHASCGKGHQCGSGACGVHQGNGHCLYIYTSELNKIFFHQCDRSNLLFPSPAPVKA